MTLQDLKLRVRALIAPRRVEQELDEELRLHIEFETQKHVDRGLRPADARARALARFGSPALAADECRDARGTAFIDNSVRDILYAFRTFRRAPLAALTIVATVALGLGLVAAVFTFYNAVFLRADAVRNPNELFEVRRPPSPGLTKVWVPLVRRDYEALLRDTSVFTDAAAIVPGVGTRIDGRPAGGTLVTGNFFQMLGTGAARGRALMPADDQRLAARPVIVLSHTGWIRLFAGDPAVIGRSVLLNGDPHDVVGIMPPGFRGLNVTAPDYWAPLGLLGQFRPALAGKEGQVGLEVIGRLKPGLSAETAMAGLTVWAAGNPEMDESNGRPKTIYLLPRSGAASADLLDSLLLYAPLFFAFGLILLIGCANVANLLLARGVARQREIGVRLSLGASRRRIVRQLLTESLLLALAAAACGYAVLRFVIEGGVRLAMSTMSPALLVPNFVADLVIDWRVIVFLLCGAVTSTVFFGFVPALQATRLELVRTMRGELTRDARPGRARNALIAVQVGASALLLICAAVFLRSAFAAASEKPGVRTSDTVLLGMANEPTRAAVIRAVDSDPSVAGVAATWPYGLRGNLAEASPTARATSDKPAERLNRLPVEYKFVSPEYFSLLDIEVVAGRIFTPAERNPGEGIVVVSETAARRLWQGREVVGQVLELEGSQARGSLRTDAKAATPQLPFRAFTVVGVVRDARVGHGMFEMVGAGVYLPISADAPGTSLVLRVNGDPDRASERLMDTLAKVDPGLGGITPLRTIAGRAISVLRFAFWLTAILGGLALVLTVSGLFSVLSYVVAQRSKEIGVRMALGARTRDVARLVLLQSARPVAVGLLLGGVLAGSLAPALLATPAASGIGRMVNVLDPVAYAASLLCIIVACALAASVPALRAARIDPIATLRQE